MKKVSPRIALMTLGILLVTACQKQNNSTAQTVSHDSDAIAQTQHHDQPATNATSPNHTASKSALQVKIIPAAIKLPQCKGKECSEIDIKQVQSNDAWVNQFFADEILNISNPVVEGKSHSLQESVDYLMTASQQDAKSRGKAVPYEVKIEPEYLGERSNISRFKIETSSYTGGAHGSALKIYYNLDRAHQKQVLIDDIVLQGQKQKLYKLVHDQFVAWVKSTNPDANIAEYEKGWPFNLTSNFNFDEKGLDFQYQQYEIAPYASGLPHFSVPYTQLKGIVKPEYL